MAFSRLTRCSGEIAKRAFRSGCDAKKRDGLEKLISSGFSFRRAPLRDQKITAARMPACATAAQ
jgi:hypothetical protein